MPAVAGPTEAGRQNYLPTSTAVWVAEGAGGEVLGLAVPAGCDELDHLYLRPDSLRRGNGSRSPAEVRGRWTGR